jgi:hypothetical protein
VESFSKGTKSWPGAFSGLDHADEAAILLEGGQLILGEIHLSLALPFSLFILPP